MFDCALAVTAERLPHMTSAETAKPNYRCAPALHNARSARLVEDVEHCIDSLFGRYGEVLTASYLDSLSS